MHASRSPESTCFGEAAPRHWMRFSIKDDQNAILNWKQERRSGETIPGV